jgi:hypothetical protein
LGGVTEAVIPGGVYEEEGLVDCLSVGDLELAEATARAAVDDVWIFQAMAEQADDMTVLAAQCFGEPCHGETISI